MRTKHKRHHPIKRPAVLLQSVITSAVGIAKRVRKIAKKGLLDLACLCRSAWNNSSPKRDIRIKVGIWVCFENLYKRLKFYQNTARQRGTSHENLCIFMIICRSILLRLRNISSKSCSENRHTHLCSILFFSINRVVHETMWQNIVEPKRSQMTI